MILMVKEYRCTGCCYLDIIYVYLCVQPCSSKGNELSVCFRRSFFNININNIFDLLETQFVDIVAIHDPVSGRFSAGVGHDRFVIEDHTELYEAKEEEEQQWDDESKLNNCGTTLVVFFCI